MASIKDIDLQGKWKTKPLVFQRSTASCMLTLGQHIQPGFFFQKFWQSVARFRPLPGMCDKVNRHLQ